LHGILVYSNTGAGGGGGGEAQKAEDCDHRWPFEPPNELSRREAGLTKGIGGEIPKRETERPGEKDSRVSRKIISLTGGDLYGVDAVIESSNKGEKALGREKKRGQKGERGRTGDQIAGLDLNRHTSGCLVARGQTKRRDTKTGRGDKMKDEGRK